MARGITLRATDPARHSTGGAPEYGTPQSRAVSVLVSIAAGSALVRDCPLTSVASSHLLRRGVGGRPWTAPDQDRTTRNAQVTRSWSFIGALGTPRFWGLPPGAPRVPAEPYSRLAWAATTARQPTSTPPWNGRTHRHHKGSTRKFTQRAHPLQEAGTGAARPRLKLHSWSRVLQSRSIGHSRSRRPVHGGVRWGQHADRSREKIT